MPHEAAKSIKRIVESYLDEIADELEHPIAQNSIEFITHFFSLMMYANIHKQSNNPTNNVNLYIDESFWDVVARSNEAVININFLKIYIQILTGLLVNDSDDINLYQKLENCIKRQEEVSETNSDFIKLCEDILPSLIKLGSFMLLSKGRDPHDKRLEIVLSIILRIMPSKNLSYYYSYPFGLTDFYILLSREHISTAIEIQKKLHGEIGISNYVNLLAELNQDLIKPDLKQKFKLPESEQVLIRNHANKLKNCEHLLRSSSGHVDPNDIWRIYFLDMLEPDISKQKIIINNFIKRVMDFDSNGFLSFTLYIVSLKLDATDEMLYAIIDKYFNNNLYKENDFEKLVFFELVTSRLSQTEIILLIRYLLQKIIDREEVLDPTIKYINLLHCYILKHHIHDEEIKSLLSKITKLNIYPDDEVLLSLLDERFIQIIQTPYNPILNSLNRGVLPIKFFNHLMAMQGLVGMMQSQLELPLQRFEPSTLIYQYYLEGQSIVEFNQFYDAAKKIIVNNPENLDIDRLLNRFFLKIFNLHSIMGSETFVFLRKMIRTSLLPVERLLSTYNIINNPPSFLAPLIIQYKNNIEGINELLVTLSSLNYILNKSIKLTSPDNDEPLTLKNILEDIYRSDDKLEAFTRKLQIYQTQLYFRLLELPYNQVIQDHLMSKISPNELPLMIIGSSKMYGDTYQDVFNEMLRYDLTPGLSFNNFIHDTHQESKLGQRLALYNSQIQKELEQAGINVQSALNYQNTRTFIPQLTENKLKTNTLVYSIWKALLNVEQSLNDIDINNKSQSDQNAIRKTLSSIANCKKQILKGKLPLSQNENNLNFLDKIKNNINLIDATKKSLDKLVSNEEIFVPFNELSDRLAQFHSQSGKQFKFTTASDTAITYTLKQWDKSKLNTLLLGDYLSCCLSPTGNQFPAIVQRRMDDAMLMHVVEDNKTKTPIAGNWLFWAKDKGTGDIYLVANYFEIRGSIGLNPPLRDEIISQLTAFTAEYAEELGAKKFLIRPLTYGLIPDFESLPIEKIEIDKVGGFFPISESDDEEMSIKQYYLVSLSLKEFHVHSYQSFLIEKPNQMSSIGLNR